MRSMEGGRAGGAEPANGTTCQVWSLGRVGKGLQPRWDLLAQDPLGRGMGGVGRGGDGGIWKQAILQFGLPPSHGQPGLQGPGTP